MAAGSFIDSTPLSPGPPGVVNREPGSAARSVFGGLVLWNAGEDDATSYAEPIEEPAGDTVSGLDLAMVVVVLSDGRKTISSTRAMKQTMTASPLYPAWVEASREDLRAALEAVRSGDLARLGEVAEANALGMHASMMAARPAIMYWLPRTIEVLHTVRAMRQDGLPAWATIDAGPNVKVLTRGGSAERVAAALRERVPGAAVSVRLPGAGVRFEEASR